MNRRKFLQAMMAGGVIIAGELWVPGQKLISIPSGKVFGGHPLPLEEGVCTIQICETLPGDRVRVVVHYEDSPDPVEYFINNVMSNKDITIEVPETRDGARGKDVQIIHGRPGDLYSRFITSGSHLEGSEITRLASNVRVEHHKDWAIIEDL